MFKDSLDIALKLVAGGRRVAVPGGHVKFLKLHMQPYGFSGAAGFWVPCETGEDPLLPLFSGREPMALTLELGPHLVPDGVAVKPLKIEAAVVGRALERELVVENVELKGDPVLYRHYRIDFRDMGAHLWGQHFPAALLVNGSVGDLIQANRAGVALTSKWEKLQDPFPVNTLPGYAHKGCASFYDFLVWYAESREGGLCYDYKTNAYTLTGEKKAAGVPVALDAGEVADMRVLFPEPLRTNERLMNAFSESPNVKETARKEAVAGLRQDRLQRFPVASEFEDAFQAISKKNVGPGHGVQLIHSRFPCVAYWPDTLVRFGKAGWSSEIFSSGIEYRLREVEIRARAVSGEPASDLNLTHARYNVQMRSVLELKEETVFTLPAYKRPAYPVYVEGRIVSEQGKDEERTYQVYEDEGTALEYYKVEIPVFENKLVVVPYEPMFVPGHFYFPAFKGQRVLVALDFHSARIERFLDFRPGSRLPMESQGNHLLLGKTTEDSTSINHVYVDGKPRMNISLTSGSDVKTIQMREGTIILETKDG